jgi:choline kinase
MVLKKEEKNGIVKAIYDSSNICASIYDKSSNDLIVIFKNGGQYRYIGVDSLDYNSFELAESNGKVLNETIKKKYTNVEKLPKIDNKELLIEIDTLKAK